MFAEHDVGKLASLSHSLITRPKSNRFDRHIHNNHELLFLVRGDMRYSIDGRVYTLAPYDLLFIPASTYHFAIPDSDAPYENYVINLDPSFAPAARLAKLFSPPYTVHCAQNTFVRQLFVLLDTFHERYTPADFAEASQQLINELLLYCSYQEKKEAPDGEEDLISRMTAYIAEHIREPLDAVCIARHLNFSRSYIQNRFSAAMGIGLQHYINQKKIYAAHNDILNGLSAIEAAEKYSYNDYSSFFRQYVKIFGFSPKTDRKGKP